MQQAQVSKHRWIVGLQFFSIVWFVAYLGIMLFYPSLGPTVTRLLDRAATAVLVWVGIVGFPACSVGCLFILARIPNAGMCYGRFSLIWRCGSDWPRYCVL